jgi:hypothetical protein
MVSDDRFRKTGRLHSEAKIELFYKSVVAVLLATMLLFALTGGVYFGAKKPEPTATLTTEPSAKPPVTTP